MRIADVCLPEPPPKVRVETQKGETHYQAAKRVAFGLQGPHVVLVRYPNPKGRGGRRGFSIQETSYYVDGGDVICQASVQGRCGACGNWAPRLLWDPWARVGNPGYSTLFCLPCLRDRLGIPADVPWPPRIIVSKDGAARCSCGGPLAYAWVWEKGGLLYGSDVITCARCGATYSPPIRDGKPGTPAQLKVRRFREWRASANLKPICWYRPESPSVRLYGDRLPKCCVPGSRCPWAPGCRSKSAFRPAK